MAKFKRVGGAIAAAFMFTAATAAATTAATPIGAQSVGDTSANAVAKPTIYLSFDDGPSLDGETNHLLDVLDRYDVPVTFFIVGDKLRTTTNQTVLRRMFADGHAVGNHSWDHSPLDALNDTQLVETQLRQTHALVKSISGYDMTCFRAPWGKSRIRKEQVPLIENFGYQLENAWQMDASEYVFTDEVPAAPAVAGQIAATLATATDGSRILMHDGVLGRSATVAGVEQFLAAHRNDFEFQVIPGCGTSTTTPPVTPPPTTTLTPPVTTPPPAGPTFVGPISSATSIADVLAASDYASGDADYLRLYHALLARNPDVPGAKYWLAQARSGSTLDDVAWSFSQSAEFAASYGALDDAGFITTVYANVFGRDPDPAGRDYWLGEVNSGGLTRHGVVRWMAESSEFRSAHPYLAR